MPSKKALVGILLMAAPAITDSAAHERDTTDIVVHAEQVRYTMAGGMGASWHAISADSVDESPDYKWALRIPNSRGSAWGGNPPVTDTAAWDQVCTHASWLGLSFLRVELSASMYEPEKGRFDWDNEEMRALYRILDWAETSNADVFLQQMWSNVGWNSYPGVQPLLSAPRSLTDFADGIAALVEHLTRTKRYHCIKWVCITNEPPGGVWGSWWSTGEKDALLTPALKEVRSALDRKKLDVPLSGPDWTDLPPFDEAKIDFDRFIGAYDLHSYQRIDEARLKTLEAWTAWARKQHKPFFLTEIGDMGLGWGGANAAPKSFVAALSNAESIMRGLGAGVSAFNRWSFTNRGDLDGQWQLVRTWDIQRKKYLGRVEIEPVAFYGYGIITRFCEKHSSVVQTEPINNPAILSQTLVSPKGMLTTYILNTSAEEKTVRVQIAGAKQKRLFLYSVTEFELTRPDFRMDPVKESDLDQAGELVLRLPGRSIHTLTNFNTAHDRPARK
jgi:hypothetical protein